MFETKHSRLIPQHRHWHEDLPERGAPDEAESNLGGDLNHIDETCLEISRTSSNMRGVMIFFGLIALATVLFSLSFIFFLPGLYDGIDWFTFFLPLVISIFLALSIGLFRLDLATPRDEPVRFNRKRGKVYVYEFKRTWNPFGKWGAVTREFDWNTLHAEVTREAGFNGAGYVVRYALVLASTKPGTYEVVDRFMLSGLTVPALCQEMWAYCKRYMEGGPEAVPAQHARIREISFRRSLFEYLRYLDPSEEGRQERKKMLWVEWLLALVLLPAAPIFAILGLLHYIAMRFAPEPVWPPQMDAESSTAPEAQPPAQRIAQA